LSPEHEDYFDFATGIDEGDVNDHQRLRKEGDAGGDEGERVSRVVVYMRHFERRELELRVQR